MTTSPRRSRAPRFRALAVVVTCLSSACADGFRALGPNPAVAELRMNQFISALTTRFAPIERDPRYDAARVKLSKAALIPSRVYGDSAMWTSRPTPTSRLLSIHGALTAGHYRLDARPMLGPAVAPGDSRHTVLLQRLGESAFRWDTHVGFAIGSIAAEDVGAVFSALLAVADGRTEADLRADYRATLPRATAAFGRGFSVDSVNAAPSASGSTAVTLTVGYHPERLQASFPAFSDYLDRYLKPAKYHLTVVDRGGGVMFDIVGRERQMTFRYRVARGALVALAGVPRPLGDTLQLKADIKLKVKMFTVGFHDLVTDFVITRTPHERAWSVIAHREPEWDLPLITERLIRTSLRRPFEGAGALLQLGIVDSAGSQTLFTRHTRLEVQESALLRFVGSLAAHMLGELSTSVELEEGRFLREAFAALSADVHALGARPGRTEIENATER